MSISRIHHLFSNLCYCTSKFDINGKASEQVKHWWMTKEIIKNEVAPYPLTKSIKNTGGISISMMLNGQMGQKRKTMNNLKNINRRGFTSYVAWIHKYSYPCSLQCIKTQSYINILTKPQTMKTVLVLLLNHYHWSRRKVWLEFCTNNTTVTVRPCNLAPNAAVMSSILLHLGLVDICHPLASIPRYLFLGVHSLDLDERCVRVLVWFGSEKHHQTKTSRHSKFPKSKHSIKHHKFRIKQDNKILPLVSKDCTSHVESSTKEKKKQGKLLAHFTTKGKARVIYLYLFIFIQNKQILFHWVNNSGHSRIQTIIVSLLRQILQLQRHVKRDENKYQRQMKIQLRSMLVIEKQAELKLREGNGESEDWKST